MRTSMEISQWLHNQGFYPLFVANLKRNHPVDWTLYICGGRGEDTIATAFNWAFSPEGFEYWADVNCSFVRWFNDIEEVENE